MIKIFLKSSSRICLLILEREEGGGGRGREEKRDTDMRKNMIGCLSHMLLGQGIDPTNFWCTGQCFNKLSNPARDKK